MRACRVDNNSHARRHYAKAIKKMGTRKRKVSMTSWWMPKKLFQASFPPALQKLCIFHKMIYGIAVKGEYCIDNIRYRIFVGNAAV